MLGDVNADDILVLGAGPAGLAVSACLRQSGLMHTVVERAPHVADSWRRRARCGRVVGRAGRWPSGRTSPGLAPGGSTSAKHYAQLKCQKTENMAGRTAGRTHPTRHHTRFGARQARPGAEPPVRHPAAGLSLGRTRFDTAEDALR